MLEVGENIVLDDNEVVRFGELEQPVCGCRRQRRTGGVMGTRIGQVKARPVPADCLRECGEIRTGRRHRHAHSLRPMRPQQRQEVEITGIIDQHRVARLEQKATDEIERMRATVGKQYVIGTSLDALFGEPPGQQGAERCRTERRGIAGERTLIVRPGDAPHRLAQGVTREPVVGQPATAGHQRVVPFAQRLAEHPQRIDLPLDRLLQPVERQRRQWSGDVEARSRPRANHALSRETLIGLHHG